MYVLLLGTQMDIMLRAGKAMMVVGYFFIDDKLNPSL